MGGPHTPMWAWLTALGATLTGVVLTHLLPNREGAQANIE